MNSVRRVFAIALTLLLVSCALMGEGSDSAALRKSPVIVSSAMQKAIQRGHKVDVAKALIQRDKNSVWLGFLARIDQDNDQVWMTADGAEWVLRDGRLIKVLSKGWHWESTTRDDKVANWIIHGGELPAVNTVSWRQDTHKSASQEQPKVRRRISEITIQPVAVQKGVILAACLTEELTFLPGGETREGQLWVDLSSREVLFLRDWLSVEGSPVDFEIVDAPRFLE